MMPLVFVAVLSVVFVGLVAFGIALIFNDRSKKIADKKYCYESWQRIYDNTAEDNHRLRTELQQKEAELEELDNELEKLDNENTDLIAEKQNLEETLEQTENDLQELRDRTAEQELTEEEPVDSEDLLEAFQNMEIQEEEDAIQDDSGTWWYHSEVVEELKQENKKLADEIKERKREVEHTNGQMKTLLQDVANYERDQNKEIAELKKFIEDNTIDLIGYKVKVGDIASTDVWLSNAYLWNNVPCNAEEYTHKLIQHDKKAFPSQQIKIVPLYGGRDNLCTIV